MDKSEIVKHTVKDSVFTNLFKNKKYLIQLYRVLHPEDLNTTEADLRDITIHNILTDDIYNDLGFLVRDRLLILAEAQSTWTSNIIIRNLFYLMTTYRDYISRNKQNIYGSKKIVLPKPELYVIYTGERKEHPEYISLSEEFFDGQSGFLDVQAKVLYGCEENDIVSQYVIFTKVYNEQMRLFGRTRKAIANTISICKDQNVLKEYLEVCETEVVSIMLAMMDEEEILLSYIETERYEAAKEAAKATAEAAAKETAEAAKKAAVQMLKDGVSEEKILQYMPLLTVDDIENLKKNCC